MKYKQQKDQKKSPLDLKGLKVLAQGRVKKDIAKERWDICAACPDLSKFNRCVHCGCFMKSKVNFKKASCPIGIWDAEE